MESTGLPFSIGPDLQGFDFDLKTMVPRGGIAQKQPSV